MKLLKGAQNHRAYEIHAPEMHDKAPFACRVVIYEHGAHLWTQEIYGATPKNALMCALGSLEGFFDDTDTLSFEGPD